MNIGIIGVGIVGGAVKQGFEEIGHTTFPYDIRFPETKIQDVLPTEITFICVPSPARDDGSCDTSIVKKVLYELKEINYSGVIVIKSTVPPGTTEALSAETSLKLAFCPEFLRERAALVDFIENHDVCVIGTYDSKDFELIKEAHGKLPKNVVHLTPKEAEFCKYFSNVYNALRITFANEFFELCGKMGVDYTKIKDAMVLRTTIDDHYLDCNQNMRGFGGMCLPKDTAALAALAREIHPDLKLFETIVNENKKFKSTTPEGMRP
jgi:UDPglucose 6-dehydrogenase